MKDKKRMLIPDNGWDIGAGESWLEDLAPDGVLGAPRPFSARRAKAGPLPADALSG